MVNEEVEKESVDSKEEVEGSSFDINSEDVENIIEDTENELLISW